MWWWGRLGGIKMSIIAILGIVAGIMLLSAVGSFDWLMRKFDRIHDGLE
jgi:hypothetical protein